MLRKFTGAAQALVRLRSTCIAYSLCSLATLAPFAPSHGSSMTMANPKPRTINVPIVPTKLATARNWLCWRYISHDKNGNPYKKPRKIPFYAKTGRARVNHGTEEDRRKLVTLAEAVQACKDGNYNGVGLAPLPDLPYSAVDFDNCLVGGKLVKPELQPLVASTYAEVSPSGNGLRLLYAGKLGVNASIKSLKAGVELFDGTGFVTVTGNRFNAKPVAQIDDAVRGTLRAMATGHANGNASAVQVNGHASPSVNGVPVSDVEHGDFAALPNYTRIERLLFSLPMITCDDRRTWLRMGMAIHSATNGDDAGFEIWDKWSRKSDKYMDGECREKWDEDFKVRGNASGRVDFGSVVYEVKQALLDDVDTVDEDDPLGVGPGLEPWPSIAMLANSERWEQSPPPKAMLFEDFMPHGELAALAGAGGEGKSWLSLQMASAVAIGMPLCGQWAPATSAGKVLMLNAEDSAEDFWRRAYALAQAQIWGPEEWQLFKRNVHVAPVAGAEKNMTKIVNGVLVAHSIAKRLRMAVEERGYKMVIIDPAIYFRAGDENDAMVQAAFMDAIAPVCCKGTCTVLVVQHVSKGTRQREELTVEDLRGSTAMGGAVRWAAVMRTMNAQELRNYPVGEEQRRQYVQMSIVKNNHGPVDGYWLHRTHGGVLQYEHLVSTQQSDPRPPNSGTRGPAPVVSDATVLEQLGVLDYTQAELAEHFNVSQPTISKMLKRLRKAGRIDQHNRPTGTEESDGDDLL
jgi:hypothetical protein